MSNLFNSILNYKIRNKKDLTGSFDETEFLSYIK